MTAREIIETRIGKAWPPTKDLAPDQRKAIKLLAIDLIRSNQSKEALRND